jgi:hypothetical protein
MKDDLVYSEIDVARITAGLRLELLQMTDRFRLKNESDIMRAHERSEIYRQLEAFGLRLNPDGKIVKL